MEEQEKQVEAKVSDKELNFRKLEQKYEKELAKEREERQKLAQQIEALSTKAPEPEDAYDDPYVDVKKLNRTLEKFGSSVKQETQTEIQKAVTQAVAKQKQEAWMERNRDFFEVMKHADKIPEVDPELAETILEMPDGFERQKLVYQNIKALGLHKERPKEPSIQEKIDQNRRSPFYQPSGFANAPYGGQGDFTATGQKQAYEQMQALKQRLRLS